MLLLCALIAGTSMSWADTASFAPSDFSSQGSSGTGSPISATINSVTFACDKGYGTTQIRCYKGGTITISSTNTITAITFTFSSGDYTGGMETSYTGLSTTEWTKTLSSQARITACTVTFESGETRTPIATDVSITDPGAVTVGASGTFAGISTDAATCTKAWTSDKPSIIEITDGTTGAYNAKARGIAKITYTITPEDDKTYAPAEAERSVTVTEPVAITASDVEMTYGDAPKAIGATTSDGYTGTVTYASANEDVATVDGSGNVTAVAAGVTTITINAGANPIKFFTASSKVINVTVNQPAGGTEAKPSTDVIALNFTKNSEWGFPTSYQTTSGLYTSGGYTIEVGTSSNGHRFDDTNTYFIMGKSGATLTLPAFSYPVTKIEVVGRSGASSSVKQNIFVGETAVSTETTGATGTNTYEINSSYQEAGTIYTLKVTSAHNTQITAINVTVDKGTTTIPAKLNASGYATFCSEYPVTFSGTEDFSAWQITDISSSNEITFERVTGGVKGGTGLLLKGTANADINITSADSDNELGTNLFVGTLVPTYAAANKYYGLSGANFVKVNAGTVPAGKALLDAECVTSSVKAFTFIFDDEATGIRTVETVSAEEAAQIFNLAGQRISKMQKGINIVNGKKILF